MLWPFVLVYAPLGYLVLFFVVAPVVVYLVVRQPRNPQFSEIWFGDIAPDVGQFLMEGVERLETIGFRQLVHARQGATNNNVSIVLTYLRNDQTGDAAIVVCAAASQGVTTTKARYVEFATHFLNGVEVDTNNSTQQSATIPVPEKISYRLPDVRDPVELFRIHSAFAAQQGTRNQKVMAAPGTELADINQGYTRDLQRQESLGVLRYDQAADCFRPTLVGAFKMTWKLAWPVKPILGAIEKRRIRTLRQQLGV